MKTRKSITLACFSLVLSFTIYGQYSASQKIFHNVGFGMGYAKTKYFSGLSGTIDYEARLNKSSVLVSVHALEELLILGGEPEKLADFSLIINRIFPLKSFKIIAGTGISLVTHKLETRNFYTTEQLYNTPGRNDFIKKRTIGLPLNFQITGKMSKRLSAGLETHANFNNLNPFFGGYLKFIISLNKK